MQYYSQCRQDQFVDNVIYNKKENGYFLEIGAYDGITLSNTFFLEKVRKWKGICVEPLPSAFAKLKSNRNCECINGCIYSTEGVVEFLHVDGASEMLSGISNTYDSRHCTRIDKELNELGGEKKYFQVKSYNLNNLLNERKISAIDYCSIDVEGSEWEVLKSIDFSNLKINVFTIENNYKDNTIKEFMFKNGYDLIGNLEMDEVFILKGNPNLPKYRIMCRLYNFQVRLNHFIKRVFKVK